MKDLNRLNDVLDNDQNPTCPKVSNCLACPAHDNLNSTCSKALGRGDGWDLCHVVPIYYMGYPLFRAAGHAPGSTLPPHLNLILLTLGHSGRPRNKVDIIYLIRRCIFIINDVTCLRVCIRCIMALMIH